VAGCGVGDYEGKMVRAQARLGRYEDEYAKLDVALSIPPRPAKQGGSPTAFNLFLRPPKGINNKADNEKEPRNRRLWSYRPRHGTAAGPFVWVEVAIGDTEKEFQAEVLGSFSGSGNTSSRKQTLRPPPPCEEVTFETTEFDDGQHFYSVNFWQDKKNQVAIVYWVQSSQRNAASLPIKMSLETFGFGVAAGKQRKRAASPLDEVPASPDKLPK
jgi:hypothetical protein